MKRNKKVVSLIPLMICRKLRPKTTLRMRVRTTAQRTSSLRASAGASEDGWTQRGLLKTRPSRIQTMSRWTSLRRRSSFTNQKNCSARPTRISVSPNSKKSTAKRHNESRIGSERKKPGKTLKRVQLKATTAARKMLPEMLCGKVCCLLSTIPNCGK